MRSCARAGTGRYAACHGPDRSPRPASGARAPDVRPPGRIPVGLLAGFAALCLVALIALAISVHGGPESTVSGLALAILPVPLVMAGVLYLDRLEPEPPVLLAATFSAGAGAAALIGLIGHVFGNSILTTPELGPEAGQLTTSLGNALVGALVAESVKGAILLGLLRYQRAELDGVGDGVVYAATIGLGFALVSNLFAYVQAERSGAVRADLGVLPARPAHPALGPVVHRDDRDRRRLRGHDGVPAPRDLRHRRGLGDGGGPAHRLGRLGPAGRGLGDAGLPDPAGVPGPADRGHAARPAPHRGPHRHRAEAVPEAGHDDPGRPADAGRPARAAAGPAVGPAALRAERRAE